MYSRTFPCKSHKNQEQLSKTKCYLRLKLEIREMFMFKQVQNSNRKLFFVHVKFSLGRRGIKEHFGNYPYTYQSNNPGTFSI